MDVRSMLRSSWKRLWPLVLWITGFFLCLVVGCGHEPTTSYSRGISTSWKQKIAWDQVHGDRPTTHDPEPLLVLDPGWADRPNPEVALRPLPSETPSPDTLTPFPLSTKDAEWLFHPLIAEAACKYQVDQALIKAIIMTESRYNAKAVSKEGAKGLMQIMPRTAKALGIEDPLDPFDNIHGGAKYLRQLLDEFKGNKRLALAAYNAGSNRVKEYRGVPPFKVTMQFVQKVFKYQRQFKRTITEHPDHA